MKKEVYKQLLEVMKKRGGRFAGMDIPEFYEMVEELFTPEEAEVNNAMPSGLFKAKDMARQMGRDKAKIKEYFPRKPLSSTAQPEPHVETAKD